MSEITNRDALIDRCDFFNFSKMIMREQKSAHKEAEQFLKQCNLTPFHAGHMVTLLRAGEGGLTLKELSDSAVCDKSNTSRVVADLESKGYLVRLKPKDGSQKKYRVALTDTGMEIARHISVRLRSLTEGIVRNLCDEDLETLVLLMEKMACSHKAGQCSADVTANTRTDIYE
ncbi:MAG: MarR family transcriptional regulator [Clostridia bacterium]|nr:MarR family transcriptional regulator [Clostridia bacterium]